jgi:thiamine-phosphate pyrophosphorylase
MVVNVVGLEAIARCQRIDTGNDRTDVFQEMIGSEPGMRRTLAVDFQRDSSSATRNDGDHGDGTTWPQLYPILDSATIPQNGREEYLDRLGRSLADAGVTLMEYRNKTGSDEEIAQDAAILRSAMPRKNIKLILDDRVHLIEKIDFDGVHVDAGDASPTEVRERLGPSRIIGTFGGGEALVPQVLEEPADYFSVGPAFPTTTKQTTKASIGVDGVRRLRAQAGPKPVLVAVGGITLETAPLMLAAGATMVAVSAAVFKTADPAAECRRWLKSLE